VEVHLRDISRTVVDAWVKQFGSTPHVAVSHGDIFGVGCDAIVSPANSFGFMDGGIDLVYSLHFGWDLQARLQERIRERFSGELPVGQATIVATGDEAIPWLVSAPTMRIPENVSHTVNAYLAFRAALLAVKHHNEAGGPRIDSLLCPGLGTAVGGMPAARCAVQMHMAWLAVQRPPTPAEVLEHGHELHRAMLVAGD